MKHIFHIHSYTCYITSIGILNKENISNDEAIFFIYRNVPAVLKEIKHVYIEDELYYFPYFTNKNLFDFRFLKVKAVINRIDKIIDKEINDDYIYYVHNSRSYLYRVFITNTKCKEVRFIEDGLDAYFDKRSFYKKYPFKVRLRHKVINYILGNLLGPRKVYKRLKQYNDPFKNIQETRRFYGLTEYSFAKFLPNNSNFFKLDSNIIRTVQNYRINKNENVFVFSALVEQHVASPDNIDKLLSWFINKFNIKKLYVNFHPHQGHNTRDQILTTLHYENVSVIVIPDNIIMETFFLNNEGINVFGIGTSLLLYAAYFSSSSKVFVLYPYLKKHLNLVTIRTRFWENTFKNNDCKNLFLYLRDFE